MFYFRSPGPNILSVISYHSSSINFSHFIFYLSSILTKWYSELGGPQYHDLVPLILKFNMAARSIMLSYWVKFQIFSSQTPHMGKKWYMVGNFLTQPCTGITFHLFVNQKFKMATTTRYIFKIELYGRIINRKT